MDYDDREVFAEDNYDVDAAEVQADALEYDANEALHDWDGVFHIEVRAVGEYHPNYEFTVYLASDRSEVMSSWDAFTLADAGSVISDLDAMFKSDLVTLDGLRKILGVQP